MYKFTTSLWQQIAAVQHGHYELQSFLIQLTQINTISHHLHLLLKHVRRESDNIKLKARLKSRYKLYL